MALTLIASGTAPKGVWTFCYTTVAGGQEFVLQCPDMPVLRPVPCFSFGELYLDVLDTTELIFVRSLAKGNRNTYFRSDSDGQSIYFYGELKAPFPDPFHWKIWRF